MFASRCDFDMWLHNSGLNATAVNSSLTFLELQAERSKPVAAVSLHHACEPARVHRPTVDAPRKNATRCCWPTDRLAIANTANGRIPLCRLVPRSDRSAIETGKRRNRSD